MTVNILLFGRNGQLGTFLAPRLAPLGHVTVLGHADVDLADSGRVAQAIADFAPRVIVNAAAYTAVDQAEADADAARAVNAAGPAAMARAAAQMGALLVHYSTDYVFDGSAVSPYLEEAPTAPLGVYGRTKLEGEQAIRAAGCDHLIIRTAWLYSHTGKNFLRTMLRLASERDELRVVDDQTGSPTYVGNVADASVVMIRKVLESPAIPGRLGTFHVTNQGATTWCGFARRIVALAGRAVRVTPIRTIDYPTPARRPAYSVLDNTRLAQAFGITLPHWEEGLRQCMMEHGPAKQL